jgi:osmoprotectant transport system substrate-binding protein
VNIRRSLPLLLAPLLVLTAAACGDDDDDDTTTPTAAVATTTADDGTTAGTGSDTATTTGGADTTSAGTATDDTGGAAGGSVVVGSADFPESQLLAQIYGQQLAATGFDVSFELGIGAREVYFAAVESGEVDLVPEYTNSLLSFVLRRDDPDALPDATNVEEQVAALGEALPDGLEVLTPSTAEDKDVIACTQDAADEFGLTNLTELGEASANITLGAPPEFETRSPFGLVGFAEIYGAEFEEFVPLNIGGVADALAAGEIDCGNLFSTMSIITTGGFVVLEDDQGTVPNEAVLPLVRSEVVTPELTAALDEVNAALDTETLKELMVRVEVDAAAPDVVAEEWLATLG